MVGANDYNAMKGMAKLMKFGKNAMRGAAFSLLVCVLFAFSACGISGRYEGEYGGDYKISASTVKRLDVPVVFTAGGSEREGKVDIVYLYEITESAQGSMIHMTLERVLYSGEDEYIIEMTQDINQRIEDDEDYKFFFYGNLKLAKETSGSFSAGDGYVVINGERLQKK